VVAEEGDFPKHVYLRAVIASPEAAQIAFTEPYETRRDTWHHFFLHVPGLPLLLDVFREFLTSLAIILANAPMNSSKITIGCSKS